VGSSTQHRDDTPVAADLAEGEVTVLDPRHRLFGCTFPLVEIVGEEEYGRYCVVRLPSGVERRIPVEATDRADVPIEACQTPLNLTTIGRLLGAYAHFIQQGGEGLDEPIESEESERSRELTTAPRQVLGGRRGPADSGFGGSGASDEKMRPPEFGSESLNARVIKERIHDDNSIRPIRKCKNIMLGRVSRYLGVKDHVVRRLVREGKIKPAEDPLDRRRKVVSTAELDRIKRLWVADIRED
jgi:hypothetical protein